MKAKDSRLAWQTHISSYHKITKQQVNILYSKLHCKYTPLLFPLICINVRCSHSHFPFPRNKLGAIVCTPPVASGASTPPYRQYATHSSFAHPSPYLPSSHSPAFLTLLSQCPFLSLIPHLFSRLGGLGGS